MAIVRSDKIDWGSVLLEQFCQMVAKTNGRVQAYAIQIGKILRFLHVEIGEDDVPSILQNTDQVGATGQTTANLAKEAVNTENIIPPTREGHNEESEPSGSVGDKSVPTGSNSKAAQDGPSNPSNTPEGPSQVSKGKEVMIEDTPVQEFTLDAEVPISEEEEEAIFQEFIRDMNMEADEIVGPYHLWEALKLTGNGQEGPQPHETENEDNWGKSPSQTDQNLGLEQIKGVIVDTITSSLNEYSIATDAKISTIQADLVEPVRASIHAEIVETVQTSIKTTIDKSVEMATALLLEMMQAMAAQIEELTKLQAARTQEKIRLDAETARRIHTEEEDMERLRKETEDNDLMLAKKLAEEEKAAQPEPTAIQAPHSMLTRKKGKRKQIASLIKQVERSGIEDHQPVGQSEEPVDEEEEDDGQLNLRKKKVVESSIASPSLGPNNYSIISTT
ncbi:cytoskeleton-associated protein 2-like [Impatiens glandulifera]|uniref:cytoskeleton-associated protein 2-like n=1 Tax=Impatiens glandulifera TaxID=253017 RepID=UPI001FB06603|nr:cytoskeleton-associated protein 2-like [Impatiens glandulifera]